MGLGAVSNALDVQFIPDEDPQLVADRDPRAPLEQPRWVNGSRADSARRNARSSPARRRFARRKPRSASPRRSSSRRCRRRTGSSSPSCRRSSRRSRHAPPRRAPRSRWSPRSRRPGRRTPRCSAARKKAAAAHLAESVAALEGIRLDLLRLHAGASDLAPLTTLMDAARHIGEDVSRLAEAQQEVEGAMGRRTGAQRTPTPA